MDDLPPLPREEGKIEMSQATKQILIVQMPKSEVYSDDDEDSSSTPDSNNNDNPIKHPEKKSVSKWFKRHITPSGGTKDTVPIRMTKAEFLSYFAKDEKTGEYKEGVVEPPGGRKEWLRQRSPENDPEQWDLRLREGRMLAKNRGTGYLAMSGLI